MNQVETKVEWIFKVCCGNGYLFSSWHVQPVHYEN